MIWKRGKSYPGLLQFAMVFIAFLLFLILLEDVSENVDAMNESNLPLYILFFVIAMHSISITLIYRVLRPAE